MDNKVVGLIGLGYWGKKILRNLYQYSVLHTACDLDLNVIAREKSKFPDINYETSIENILQIPEIKGNCYYYTCSYALRVSETVKIS